MNPPPTAGSPPPAVAPSAAAERSGPAAGAGRPVLPPGVPQAFLPASFGPAERCRPHLLGLARVSFVESRAGIEHAEDVALLVPVGGAAAAELPGWDAAREVELDERELAPDPPAAAAAFDPVPGPAADPGSYRGWERDLADTLYRGRRLELLSSRRLKLVARPDESERDFRVRVAEGLRQARDAEMERLREGWARRLEAKREQVRRADQAVGREREQADDRKRQAWVDAGASLFGALLGRKALSATNMRRAGTVMRGFSRSGKESADVERAGETLRVRQEELAALEADAEREAAELGERFDPAAEELETVVVHPRRSDVEVRRVLLAWG